MVERELDIQIGRMQGQRVTRAGAKQGSSTLAGVRGVLRLQQGRPLSSFWLRAAPTQGEVFPLLGFCGTICLK